MSTIELILLAVGLAMDAFAVSICTGLSLKEIKVKDMLTVGFYFGLFQALMPVIGYFAGSRFLTYIESFDHWVVFVLLFIVGIRMVIESRKGEDEIDEGKYSLKFSKMIILAILTSIDALAVGVSFAILDVGVFMSATVIGAITFAVCAVGVRVGKAFGQKNKAVAELCGGIVLILIGTKILLEHLGVINF